MLLTTPTLKVVAAATTASLYDLSARDINGQLVPLSFEGGRQGNWGQPIGWLDGYDVIYLSLLLAPITGWMLIIYTQTIGGC